MSRDLIAFPTNDRRSPVPETPRSDDHDDRYSRYLLSLDGGGVRGLSTLLILRNIMHRLNEQRKDQRRKLGFTFTCELKPCDVFDLIGGTSTGGLIAIMLGRLEMDVESCLETYREFIPRVFGADSRSSWPFPLTPTLKLNPVYRSENMREAVINIIRRRVCGSDKKEPTQVLLREDVPESSADPGHPGHMETMCKVFVCTTPEENPTTTSISLLRSYPVSFEVESVRPTIVQAALATTAAPLFFAPVEIPLSGGGSRHYVDGALDSNNPVKVVEKEARYVFLGTQPGKKPPTPSFVPCLLSIGTGILGKPASLRTASEFIQTLGRIATETEKTAKEVRYMWKEYSGYHRFNVDQGLQDMKIDERNPEGRIEAVTEEYLKDDDIIDNIWLCAQVLANKQHHPSSIVSLIEAGEESFKNRHFSKAYEEFDKADKLVQRHSPDRVDRARFVTINLGMAKAMFQEANIILQEATDIQSDDAKDLRNLLDGALRRVEDVKKVDNKKSHHGTTSVGSLESDIKQLRKFLGNEHMLRQR